MFSEIFERFELTFFNEGRDAFADGTVMNRVGKVIGGTGKGDGGSEPKGKSDWLRLGTLPGIGTGYGLAEFGEFSLDDD